MKRLSTIKKYTAAGLAFGACFPIGALAFEWIRVGHQAITPSIQQLHMDNPILFMIDTAPIFLGLFAMFGGKAMTMAEMQKKSWRRHFLTYRTRKAAYSCCLMSPTCTAPMSLHSVKLFMIILRKSTIF